MKKLITAIALVFSAGAATAEVVVVPENSFQHECYINFYDEIASGHIHYWLPYVTNNLHNDELTDSHTLDPTNGWQLTRACIVKALRSHRDAAAQSNTFDLNIYINTNLKDVILHSNNIGPLVVMTGDIPGTIIAKQAGGFDIYTYSYDEIESRVHTRFDHSAYDIVDLGEPVEGVDEAGNKTLTYTTTLTGQLPN